MKMTIKLKFSLKNIMMQRVTSEEAQISSISIKKADKDNKVLTLALTSTSTQTLKPRSRRRFGSKLLIVAMLIVLATILTGCTIPGEDYNGPCGTAGGSSSSNGGKASGNCANPVQQVQSASTSDNNAPWYIGWLNEMVQKLVGNTVVSFFDSATYTFWDLFTQAASTDFHGCGTSMGGSNWGPGAPGGPVCMANEAELEIAQMAFGLVFFLLVWNGFRGYLAGHAEESWLQGATRFVPRIALAFLAIGSLGILISGAFGFSNMAFMAISGGPGALSKLLGTLVGNDASGGIANIVSPDFRNLALMLANAFLIIVLIIEILCLALTFLMRTVLIYIFFATGPFAIVASTEPTLRPWFNRWLSSIINLLVAPIPVAVALRMAQAFVTLDSLNAAITNTLQFMESLVFLAAFFFIAAILQWKIAGQVGGFAFGLATSVAGGAGGWAAGKLMATRAIKFGGRQSDSSDAGAGAFESETYTSTGALRATTTPEALALGAGANPMMLPAPGGFGGTQSWSMPFSGGPGSGGAGAGANIFDTMGRDLRSLTDTIANLSQAASNTTTGASTTAASTNTMFMPGIGAGGMGVTNRYGRNGGDGNYRASAGPSYPTANNQAGNYDDEDSFESNNNNSNAGWSVGPDNYRYSYRAANAINTTLRWAGSQVVVGGPSYDFSPSSSSNQSQSRPYDYDYDYDQNYRQPQPPAQHKQNSNSYWDSVYYGGHNRYPGPGNAGGAAIRNGGGGNIPPYSPTPAPAAANNVPASSYQSESDSTTIWTPPSYRRAAASTSTSAGGGVTPTGTGTSSIITVMPVATPLALPAARERRRSSGSNTGAINNNQDW